MHVPEKFQRANTESFRDNPLSFFLKTSKPLQLPLNYQAIRISADFVGMIYPGVFIRQPRQNSFYVSLLKIRYSNSGPISFCCALDYPPKNAAQMSAEDRGIIALTVGILTSMIPPSCPWIIRFSSIRQMYQITVHAFYHLVNIRHSGHSWVVFSARFFSEFSEIGRS